MTNLFEETLVEDWEKKASPSFQTITNFYKSYGLRGEESNAILLTIALASKVSLGIISLSGSGKSFIADIFFKKLIEKELYFNAGTGSKTAIVNNFRDINNSKMMYIEELQKVIDNEINKEMLKNILEGKEYVRRERRITVGGDLVQTINPLPVCFTVALENEHKDYNEAEFSRRSFLTLNTDISAKTTGEVVKYKLQNRFNKQRLKIIEPEETEFLRTHIKTMLSGTKFTIENPFSEYFEEIIDTEYLRVRSLLDVYLDVMECCCKWNINSRIKLAKEKETLKFMELQDVLNANVLYGEQFHRTVLQVPMLGMKILKVFDEYEGAKKIAGQRALIEYKDSIENERNMLTVEMIHRHLRKKKEIISHNVINSTCEILCEGNYLEKERLQLKVFYSKVFDVDEFHNKLDLKKCWEEGCENMKKTYPEVYEEWKNKQMENGVVMLRHPVTGEKIDIENIKEVEKISEKKPNGNKRNEIINDITNNNSDIDLLSEKYGEDVLKEMESRGEIYKEGNKYFLMR